eukprot:m.10514 g.10514  ORF g.10514 m.10514 type:complete len:95 (+) comp6633_c0_seq1:199-483(+)
MCGMSWNCLSNQAEQQPRRPRIDRSMIGNPTNFVHAGHIGTGDSSQLGQMKDQMASKGEANDDVNTNNLPSPVENAISLEEAQKKIAEKNANKL